MVDLAALQLLVPGAAPLLDAVRGQPGVGLLEPAHVSLGYPWRAAKDADAGAVARAAALVPPFVLRFDRLSRFAPDSRGRVVLHVVPDDDRLVRILAAAVDADLRSTHLSVARVLSGTDVEQVAGRVEHLFPLVCRVGVLELTVQQGGVWQSGIRFPLGRQGAPSP